MKKMFFFLLIVLMIPVYSIAESTIAEMSTDELSALLVSAQQELASRLNDDPDKNLLFYEDENISIEFCDFWVNESSSYTSIKLDTLIKNKTNEIVDVSFNTLTVNGCVVKLSKYTEIPPNAVSIHTWSDDAEQYLKYKIDKPSTFTIILDYELLETKTRSNNIVSQEVVI